MGIIRYHGRALRLNGLTDGLIVPTGKFKESGKDIRHPLFESTAKNPKSNATKIGRMHEEQMSNPLNSFRTEFTVDAFIIPDYGGVILDKPGQFKLSYGKPFTNGPLVFDVISDKQTYRIETSYNIPVSIESNSGTFADGGHKPQELTLGEQPLVMITAQFGQEYMRCYINGDLVGEINFGGDTPYVVQNSSDLFIGGQGGEYRGLIESIRVSRGIIEPNVAPLTKQDSTLGLWLFEDDYESPDIYFFDNARAAVLTQGRDGPDTHDGLMPIPMVAMAHTFSGNSFKLRDYPSNPNSSVDRYTALEKLASLMTGVELKDIANQTWSVGTLDLTDGEYFDGVSSTTLNAIFNHSGTHPLTGVITSPASRRIRWADDVATSTSAAVDHNPMIAANNIERVRITGIDFANNKLIATSTILANSASSTTYSGGRDNLPITQNPLFPRSADIPIWFMIGKTDLLIDTGNESVSTISQQRTRASDTFTKYLFTQGQRFSDLTSYNHDAYFVSPKSRMTGLGDGTVLSEPSDSYPAMGGVTSYSLYEGDFYLKKLPIPKQQTVKQTVQGIANTFEYISEDIHVDSIIGQNDIVKVTETVFTGEIERVVNTSNTVMALKADNAPFNRIVTEDGVGYFDSANNMSSSTRDEIVAIAVENIKPFLLKGLDDNHTASIVGGVPTNDSYIRHLTPEKEPRIAVIESPSVLVSAGGPKKILVYYDAIDLTGEVVAGTGFNLRSGINVKFNPFHAIGNKGYLVVKKTVPNGSAVFNNRTIADYLRVPYTNTPSNTKEVLLKITAPGGLVSVSSASFNRPIQGNILSSNPTGDITPSPFINIEDCVLSLGTSIRGYGRPKAVPSTNTPDASSNSEYHTMVIENIGKRNLKTHTSNKQTPSSFRKSNLLGFDVVDNDIKADESYVLVHPTKRSRFGSLDDIMVSSDGTKNASIATLELTLMKGRIEEVSPTLSEVGSFLALRGRSILMDISDSRAERDFDLSQGTPVKEIGDLGTPSVSLTLGGLGQGGIDIQPVYDEHPLFPGWKDRIVGSGNNSVRNDKQASTYYASTRALTEIPLFPSMFYDVDKIEKEGNDSRTPISSNKRFKMTVDTTMTAMNRPQMKEHESRYAIDWGLHSEVASVEITEQYWDFLTAGMVHLIRCQRPSVQAVQTGWSSPNLTVDDYSAFLKATGERGEASYCNDSNFYITIGEGVLNDGLGVLAKASIHGSSTNVLVIDTSHVWHPLTLAAQNYNTLEFDGAVVTLGGYVPINGGTAVDSECIANLADVISQYNTAYGTPSDVNYLFDLVAPLLATEIATAVRHLFGKTANAIQVDPNNPKRYLIKDGPNMEAFDFDVLELYESNNDRPLVPPIICKTSHLALKGKKTDGTSLEYTRPLEIDFSDIALKMDDFEQCVNEVIRIINMAAHPQAKNSTGDSAFNPPALFTGSTSSDTGTHMGYVRAFEGANTESREGERGRSIVIHSTVPGATGRNFAVHLSNRTPYPYKPASVTGYAGLLATNSRAYLPNSFPAPMPIGEDGESYVPISTFRGAPHGSITDADGNIRTYDGLGGRFVVKTIAAPTTKNSDGSVDSVNDEMVKPTSYASTITSLAVSLKAEDWNQRTSQLTSSINKGILSVNGRIADFDYISQYIGFDTGENCFFIHNIVARNDPKSFYNQFFDGSDRIGDIDVEILWPRIDSEGIVFFGGGHTGVVLDVSDGTANDYSDDYKHHYSKGPTGFSGFQNLHEVSTATAILDFTDITNNDTINDNTLQGVHHKLIVDNGEVKDGCRLYMRMNQTIGSGTLSQSASVMTEDLYGSPVRVTGTGGDFTLTNGPAYSVDNTDKGMLFGNNQALALYNYNSGVEAEYGPMKDFDCRGDFSISVWFKCNNASTSGNPASGPIITGRDSGGRFWGLVMAGGQNSSHSSADQYVNFGLIACEADGTQIIHFNDVTRLGLRIDRDAWTNIIVTKSGSTASFYLANESYLKFGKAGYQGGEATLTGQQNIGNLTNITDYSSAPISAFLRNTKDTGMSPSQVVAATIPSALGTTAAANMTLIGLSALRDIANSTNNGGNYQLTNQYAGTYASPTSSAVTAVMSVGTTDGTNGIGNPMTNAVDHYLWNCYLSNLAVFNHALTATEAAAIWAAKGEW